MKKFKDIIANKIKMYKDVILLISFTLILSFGFSSDGWLNNYFPNWIFIDNKIKGDLQSNVFSAQVSISTLGIALIAILGGLFKEDIYGVNIIKYLTNDKPLIFKHKTNIVLQLILILISYICISFDYYNSLISIFIISIFITIIMVIDIFSIFKGSEYLKNEIYYYIIDIFNKNKLDKNKLHQSIIIGLKNETIKSIEENNILILKDNLELYKQILDEITNYNEKDKNSILELYEDSISEIYNKIFEEKNSNKVIIAIKSMGNLYRICNDKNKLNKNKTYIDIYERVYYRIFSAIATVFLNDVEEQYHLIYIQYDLYNNMSFIKNNEKMIPQNNSYLHLYSGRIYYEIKRKGFENYNTELLSNIKEILFTKLQDYIAYYTFDEFKDEKINQIYMQLYQYTKTLIDNYEEEVLENVFFEKIKDLNRHSNNIDSEYVFTIIIYMYYLIEFEELVEETLKKKLRTLIESNKYAINDFLLYNIGFKFTKSNVTKIKSILSRWERMPPRVAKSMIMDNVIEKFLLMYSLEQNSNGENLINDLKPLVEENEFSVYNNINESKDILNTYIDFRNLLLKKSISKQEAEDKIDMLKYAITVLYKDSELKRSKKEVKTEEEYKNIKEAISIAILESFKEKINIFNKKSNGNEICESVSLSLLTLHTSTEFLNKSGINEIKEIVNLKFIEYIIRIVYEKLQKDKVQYNNENLLIRFFELLNQVGTETDTLIGYRDYFYGIKEVEKFKNFEKDKIKIKYDNFNNCIISIDSQKLYINIKNISVEIKKKDIDQLCSSLKKNKNGEYLYNVTNDIYIPFSKEELKIYFDNKMRDVIIKADIEYRMQSDIIGAGIFLYF